ncbi:site-2 protease family protein [Thermodesulfovibrionales bacterium]|nr:site-2 protease family protein [Thermodesulfovibrionales bacterium]
MDIVAHILLQIAIFALPLLIAITFHEAAHGFMSNKLGDPTAKMMGRLTLNPIVHIDLFGTILMPVLLLIVTAGQFAFGYAKPVPINPYNFKNPKRDMAISAAAGPAANIALAVLSMLLIQIVFLISIFMPTAVIDLLLRPLELVLIASITINVILAVFNIFPIPPLDGGRILMGVLPHKEASILGKIEPYGIIIVLILVVTGVAGAIIFPFVRLFLDLVL